MRRALLLLLLAACPATLGSACRAPSPTDEPSLAAREALRALAPWGASRETDVVLVHVVLEGQPAAEVALGGAPGSPAVVARSRERLAQIEAQHDAIRPALLAEGAVVVAEMSRLVNAMQVRVPAGAVARLSRLPGVVRLEPVPLHERSNLSAVPFIGAPAVWARTTPLQGDGVRIGIIDSGVDYTHADFGAPGDPADYLANDPKVVEPGSFPTARVTGGHDFAGDSYDASASGTAGTPKPDKDPLDCAHAESMQIAGGHGTHVAGIAAGGGVLKDGSPFTGPYEQSLDPSAFLVGPGVAPRASIHALKVFGCQGSTGLLLAALDHASDPDQDGDFSDRLDVVNASLGSSYAAGAQSEATAIRNLTALGTLLVAAAGNEGSSFFAAGAPGVVSETLSVAATGDTRLVLLRVLAPSTIAGDFLAAEGVFTAKLAETGPIQGALVLAEPNQACGTLQNAAEIAGNVALVDRGSCSFVAKLDRLLAAGAIAAVVIDDDESDVPLTMSGSTPVAMPGVAIRMVDGASIKAHVAEGLTVTLDGTPYDGPGSQPVAGFSSRGPSGDGGGLKPDIAAPGVAMDSAGVGTGSGARNNQGTSMSSPMVAGAAALVRQGNPALGPEHVKAALMNAAGEVIDATGVVLPPSIVGAGGVRVLEAVTHHVTALAADAGGAVGVSFGAIVTAEPASRSRAVLVENHGAVAVDYDAVVGFAHALDGVSLTVAPPSFSVPPGGSVTLALTLAVDPAALGAPGPDPSTPAMQFEYARHYLNEATGRLALVDKASGGQSITLPFHAVVRAAARVEALAPTGCVPDGPVRIPLGGASAHPSTVTTAFELGAVDDRSAASDTDPAQAVRDILAVGAATSYATAPSFDESTVSFGLVVAGEWTTPALGSFSQVGVSIDTDFDGIADFEIVAEPLTRDGPYADVLAATTYDRETDEALPSKRFVNFVPASEAETHPFFNSVLVLGVRPAELGLTETNAAFAYAAFTRSATSVLGGEKTAYARFDAVRPVLDTSRGGPSSRPLYASSEPVVVHVDTEAAGDAPLPGVLLLHHTNEQGARFEVVELEGSPVTGRGDVAIAVDAPGSVAAGEAFELVLTVSNGGTVPVPDVRLDASVSGAVVVAVASPVGSCSAGAAVACELGALEPGAAVKVTIAATAPASSPAAQVTFDAEVGSLAACEASLEGNALEGAIPITAVAAAGEPLAITGGCGCRVGGEGQSPVPAALVGLAALSLCAARRRRARAS